MPASAPTKPVGDTVAKVNNEIAVGSDLQFQRKWWKFEHTVWAIFTAIVIADVLGCFGRGHFAKAEARTSDQSLDVKYERIERFRTPSIMTVKFGPHAGRDGKLQLWASDSLVKPLGNQRIIPQPESSVVGNGGVLYTFTAAPSSSDNATVEFALEPGSAGMDTLKLMVPGHEPVTFKIWVMP